MSKNKILDVRVELKVTKLTVKPTIAKKAKKLIDIAKVEQRK